MPADCKDCPIDPVQFGKLIQGVEDLTGSVQTLNKKLEKMEERVSLGRGIILGAVTVGSLGGAGFIKVLERLLHG